MFLSINLLTLQIDLHWAVKFLSVITIKKEKVSYI